MDEEMVRLAVEIANQVDQEKDLPENYRADAFRLILEHRLRAGREEAPRRAVVSVETSFNEFLNQLGDLGTNPQRFAAVAYYFDRTRQETSVTQNDIVTAMRNAGLRRPGNFSRDIRVAISPRNALLMSAERKDGAPAWQLTRTGRLFLEGRLAES